MSTKANLLHVILLLWVVTGAGPVLATENVEQCLECHDDSWRAGQSKAFIHRPFLEKQCLECHYRASSAGGVTLPSQADSAAGDVEWLVRHTTPAAVHWLRFPPPPAGDFVIDATANRKLTKHFQLPLPELAGLPHNDNDRTPPRITGVKVVEVRIALFRSATIEWETDEAADARIDYGIDDPTLSSPLDGNFSTRHQVTLMGIAPDKTYRFRAVSGDLHGNRATSDILTFSSQAPFSLLDGQTQPIAAYSRNIEITPEFFQSDGEYLVKISANQPVEVALGLLPVTELKASAGNEEEAVSVYRHPVTTDAFQLNISLCFKCHQGYKDGPSHPVNVYPKRGMTIPPEYPTLADGRMTCSTCHERHASNRKFRTIWGSKKELCLGCHKDMG